LDYILLVMAKNILVISPTPTHPPTAGNRVRIQALLSGVKSLGHNVYFLYIRREGGDDDVMRKYWGENYFACPYRRQSSRLRNIVKKIQRALKFDLAYTYKIDEWYDPGIDWCIKDFLKDKHIDTVIVEYVFFSRVLDCFGDNVLKIIDTHDIFSNRHQKFLKHGNPPDWFSTTVREESKGLARADIVIAIQHKEEEFFKRITKRQVITVGHIVPLYKPGYIDKNNKRILFIGSNNKINLQAANFFIDDIYPIVIEHMPTAELAIAGGLCNVISDREGLVKLGEMQDMKPAYESATLIVNPILFGTGLKIKTIEALGYSKPLVTTSVGAEGLEDGSGNAFYVKDTPVDFANGVIEILANPDIAHKLSKNAYEYAARWNKKCLSELDNMLAIDMAP